MSFTTSPVRVAVNGYGVIGNVSPTPWRPGRTWT